MREYELFQILEQMLDDRFQHVATKVDMVQLHADNKGIKKTLDGHLDQHKKDKAALNKIKLAAAGAIVTGLVSMGLGWIF
jgi:hypothetical protein